MKTALDLPDDLVREIRIEAARRGAKLKDLIAELLRAGLNTPRNLDAPAARLMTDPQTGLTVVAGTRPAELSEEITPARAAEILRDQESEWALEAGR